MTTCRLFRGQLFFSQNHPNWYYLPDEWHYLKVDSSDFLLFWIGREREKQVREKVRLDNYDVCATRVSIGWHRLALLPSCFFSLFFVLYPCVDYVGRRRREEFFFCCCCFERRQYSNKRSVITLEHIRLPGFVVLTLRVNSI